MLGADQAFSTGQRCTAYTVAAEIMSSDGPLEGDERNILANLADAFALDASVAERVAEVMSMLRADVLYGLH